MQHLAMHSSDRSVKNGFRASTMHCVKSDCDDAGIVNVSLSGDIITDEDRINREV